MDKRTVLEKLLTSTATNGEFIIFVYAKTIFFFKRIKSLKLHKKKHISRLGQIEEFLNYY